ncbi:MAG: 50S ribosomal protein L21 [Candidatus Improbicoccus devescovinae]|nr:MAG: 50S ribosomal protein L21 [Candidatus Improbicoccus devescovinae]
MEYAVIQATGKQYLVRSGDEIFLDNLNKNIGDHIKFNVIFAKLNDTQRLINSDSCSGLTVTGEVFEVMLSKKLRIFTYKPKKNHKRAMGERHQRARVRISFSA